MKTSTVNLTLIEPSENMHILNKKTGEIYEGCVYIASSIMNLEDFEEISENEYFEILKKSNIE